MRHVGAGILLWVSHLVVRQSLASLIASSSAQTPCILTGASLRTERSTDTETDAASGQYLRQPTCEGFLSRISGLFSVILLSAVAPLWM